MDWLDKQVPPVPQERLVALGPGERREITARMELPAYKGSPEKQGRLVRKVIKVQQAQQGSKANEEKQER